MRYEPLERLKYPIRAFVIRHANGPHTTRFLALFSAIESIISPLPVETLLGPLIVVRPEKWRMYAAVAASASVVGALVGYALGYLLFDAVGEAILAFYGLEEQGEKAATLLRENMFTATFISAFTPIPYKVFALTAGALQGPILTFIVASILGRGIRMFLFSYLVHRFGTAVARIVFRYFTLATILVLVLLLVVLGIYFL